MKKFLLVAAFALFVSTCISNTYAQTSTGSATPPRLDRVGLGIDKAASKAAERSNVKLVDRLMGIKEKIASRSALLKEKLKGFRDPKKAEIVERVNDRLANINEVRTNNMMKNLKKMSEILAKLDSRVNGVTGKDTTAAKSAISDAKAKVASAEAAVKAQADKDYPIEATSEAVIKNEIVGIRLGLHSDLRSIHSLVVEARKAVANAIMTVAKTLGGLKSGQQ